MFRAVLAVVGLLNLHAAAAPEPPLFERDILPLFQAKCLNCHGADDPKGGLDLRSVLSIKKGGEGGPALHPVFHAKGSLWQQVESGKMPPGNKTKLTDEEKAKIYAWVQAGAPDGKGTGPETAQSAVPKWSKPLGARRDHKLVAAEIDALLETRLKAADIPVSPPSDDAEFLRRVSLDLTGLPPTADRARAFLASTESDKRAKLIDELLADVRFGRHLSVLWHNRIYPLNAENRRFFDESLYLWMAKQFNENRPWSQTVASMLTAEGELVANRNQMPSPEPQIGLFLASAEEEYPQPDRIAAAVMQLFLGVQLQCAQCHNHPFARWKQDDFWGTAVFFARVGYDADIGQTRNKKEKVVLKETAKSVIKGGKRSSFVRDDATIEIPEAKGRIVAARFIDGVAPPLTPDEPFRPAFTQWATSRDNTLFAKAGVNRVWAQMFGRGIVNPVNDLHEGNPPSHPELMEVLAREFAASDHDLKHLYRAICNTRAYQRSSRPLPGNKNDDKLYSHMALKQMSPEVLFDAARTVFRGSEAAYEKELIPVADGGRSIRDAGRQMFLYATYSQEAGEDATRYTHGVTQALRLMNSQIMMNGDGPLAKKLNTRGLLKIEALEEIYLSALARRPTDAEAKFWDDFLAAEKGNPDYRGIVWALLNSSEFLFNH